MPNPNEENLRITGEIKLVTQNLENLTKQVQHINERNTVADKAIGDIKEYIAGQRGYYKAQEALLKELKEAQKDHHDRVEKTIQEAIDRHEETISKNTDRITILEHKDIEGKGKWSGIALVFSCVVSLASFFFGVWHWIKSFAVKP